MNNIKAWIGDFTSIIVGLIGLGVVSGVVFVTLHSSGELQTILLPQLICLEMQEHWVYWFLQF